MEGKVSENTQTAYVYIAQFMNTWSNRFQMVHTLIISVEPALD